MREERRGVARSIGRCMTTQGRALGHGQRVGEGERGPRAAAAAAHEELRLLVPAERLTQRVHMRPAHPRLSGSPTRDTRHFQLAHHRQQD